MSGGMACRCPRPVRERLVVIDKHCNFSAFSGYQYTPSRYSSVACCDCGRVRRTSAFYVETLPPINRDLWQKTGRVEPAVWKGTRG